MKTVEATFRIVTPMFIGGADQTPDDGVRPPSVKGALRFWWRAMNWNKFRAATGATDASALKELHDAEAKLFGLSAKTVNGKQVGGQGCFLLQVTNEKFEGHGAYDQAGQKYLLGQGVNARNCLNGGTFSTKILFRPTVSEHERKEVVKALMAWGLLGGLGSRSRHGIGSVAVMELNGTAIYNPPKIPKNISEYKNVLAWLGLPPDDGIDLPPFSAFSKHSRVDCSLTGSNAMNLLNKVGIEMKKYRSYGLYNERTKQHEVDGKKAEKNFSPDHDEMLKAVQGTSPMTLPCRAVFGLPHNYFFKSEFNKLQKEKKEGLTRAGINELDAEREAKQYAKRNAVVELSPSSEERARRASPLLIHAHQFPDNTVAIIQTLLPATFLPIGEKITFKAKRLSGGQKKISVPTSMNWNTIIDYLDRFPSKIQVLP